MYYDNNYYRQDDYSQSSGDSYYSDDYANNETNLNVSLMSVQSNAEANDKINNLNNDRVILEQNGIIQDVKKGNNHSVFKQKRRKNGEIIFTKQNKSNHIPVNENTTFYSCFTYSILHGLGEFKIDAAKQIGINSFKSGGEQLEKHNTHNKIYDAMLNVLQIGTSLTFDGMYAYKHQGDRRNDNEFIHINNIEKKFEENGQVKPSEYREVSNFYKGQIDALVKSIRSNQERDTFLALYVLAYDFGFFDIKDFNWCYNPKTGKLTNIDYDSGIAIQNPTTKERQETPSLFSKPSFFLIRQKVFRNYVENSPFLRERLNDVRNRMDKIISYAIWENQYKWSNHYTSLLAKSHGNTMDRKLNNMTNSAIRKGIDPITQIYNAYCNNTDQSFDIKFQRTAQALSQLYKNKERIYDQLILKSQQKKYSKIKQQPALYNNRQMTPDNGRARFYNNAQPIVQNNNQLPQIVNRQYTPQSQPKQQRNYQNNHQNQNNYDNYKQQPLINNRQLTPEEQKANFFNQPQPLPKVVNNPNTPQPRQQQRQNYQNQNNYNDYYQDEFEFYQDQQMNYEDILPPIRQYTPQPQQGQQYYNNNVQNVYNYKPINVDNKQKPAYNQKHYDYKIRRELGIRKI